jgi:ferric-dicitrate binding protein FerR (iron transport regulator)
VTQSHGALWVSRVTEREGSPIIGTGTHSAARRRSARRLSRTTKSAVVVAAAVALVGIGGGAFGYQVDVGTGPGSGAAGGLQAVTALQTSTVTGLAPGSGTQPLSGTFDNLNSGPTYVTAVRAHVVEVNDAHGSPIAGCTAGDFLIAGAGAVGAQVPAGAGVGSWGNLTIEFHDTDTNQDACQGAQLVIGYAIS